LRFSLSIDQSGEGVVNENENFIVSIFVPGSLAITPPMAAVAPSPLMSDVIPGEAYPEDVVAVDSANAVARLSTNIPDNVDTTIPFNEKPMSPELTSVPADDAADTAVSAAMALLGRLPGTTAADDPGGMMAISGAIVPAAVAADVPASAIVIAGDMVLAADVVAICPAAIVSLTEGDIVPHEAAADVPEIATDSVSASDPAEAVDDDPAGPTDTLAVSAPAVAVADLPGSPIPYTIEPGDVVA
jgi:hypothetical protein